MSYKRLLYSFFILVAIISLRSVTFASEASPSIVIEKNHELKDQFHLDHVVKLYVPSTYDVDQPIDNTPYVNRTLEKFSGIFGGATAIDGQGAWLSDEKKLVKEKVTIVYSFGEKLDRKTMNQVVDYAKLLKEEMKQSAVSLEVDGKLYFIE